MNKKKRKTIGILGGMGPEASSSLYKQIIEYCQHEYNAVQDYDYPSIVLYSLPLKGFDETGIKDSSLVKKQLEKGVKVLESAGSDLIIIACNTVHIYYKELQSQTGIPIFNIIEETKKAVTEKSYKKVGLFCSQSTNNFDLYPKSFNKNNIAVISPNKQQQNDLNRVIEHVMGGHQGKEDVITLKNIAFDYINQGAGAIILGCTEIPLAINQVHTDIKLYDSMQIILKAAVDYSFGHK